MPKKEQQATTRFGQSQSYNVLCTTLTHKDKPENWSKKSRYHETCAIGEAIVIASETKVLGVKFDTTVVRFLGFTWKLLYTRSGLNGTAVTLGIERPNDDYYDIWELYTDTPTSELISVEEVREQAKHAISHRIVNY